MSDTEREALIDLLVESRDRDYAASVYKFTPAFMADAILESDWLATHEAQVRAEERERIAAAIEAAWPPHDTRVHTPADKAYVKAIRIARAGGAS